MHSLRTKNKCLRHVQVNDSRDMQKLFSSSDSGGKNVSFLLVEEKKIPCNNFVVMLSLGATGELEKPRALIKHPGISIASSITVL